MKAMFKMCGIAAAVASLTHIAAASPPPPPPTFIDELAQRIVPTQTTGSFDQYTSALADDLTISINGALVTSGKAAWIAAERHRLGKVDRRVLAFVEGHDSILVIDRYDDRSALPTSPGLLFDPRYKTRAVQYSVGSDHLVHAIRILDVDGFVLKTQPLP